MKVITGHQPVYLPWLGLFHKISLAEVFVFMDDVQYLEKDWNNRNRIKGPQGPFWLTVPVRPKQSSSRIIKDIIIADDGFGSSGHWQNAHWRSLQSCYGKAPHWAEHAPFFEKLYTASPWKWLTELNETTLHYCLDVLGLQVQFIRASQYGFEGYKSNLVLDHCRKLGGDISVLGTLGKDYVIEEDFFNEGISVHYQDYRHPTYSQRFGDFRSHLSVLDLLFNCGPDSRNILLSGNITTQDLIDQVNNTGRPSRIEFSLAKEGAV